MRFPILFRLVVSLSLILGIAKASLAQEPTAISVHRTCIAGGSGEQLHLRYWSPEVNNGHPEPVCVFKVPVFGGKAFLSARVESDRSGIGATVIVEFDETARPLIEKMSRDNVWKVVAIVVGDKIVSMPMITRPYSDNRLLISVPGDSEAARIVAALIPVSAKGKK